jgi:hypothetical protein
VPGWHRGRWSAEPPCPDARRSESSTASPSSTATGSSPNTPVGIRQHTRSDGKPPLLYSLTRRGLEIAQTREPPAISQRREWRPIEPGRALRLAHDLHALAWAIELHRLLGNVATDHWRTPRYATGRYPVPQTGTGRHRHPITNNEIPIPDRQAIIDLELKTFPEVKPDLSLELHVDTIKLTFDLLVELDLTARPSYNHDKFLAYDAFLCGWSLAHPRYRTQGTRPAVVFVCPSAHAAMACAREADELMTGRIGVMGTGPEHWYHAGRDHLFFAVETDIDHGNLSALALPPHPPGLRERLTGQRELEIARVELLPDTPRKRWETPSTGRGDQAAGPVQRYHRNGAHSERHTHALS